MFTVSLFTEAMKLIQLKHTTDEHIKRTYTLEWYLHVADVKLLHFSTQ